MRTRHAATRALLVLSAALAVAVPAPLVTAAPGVPASREEVDAAVAFRERLGLPADRAFVAATFGRAGFSQAKWGVPLDANERRDVARRAQLQKALGRAFRAWANDGQSAGAYIDQHAHGAPVFLTTGDPARARGRVAKDLPAGAGGRFQRVARSMDQLLDLQDTVNADQRAGLLAGLGVVSTAIDARSNAVVVGIAEDTPAVRAALLARYGNGVRPSFELPAQGGDACTNRTDCAPAKGGIEIRSSYNGNNCTIGFLVRVAGSGLPRLLTAGHCIGKSGGTGTSRKWTHDGSQMGWAEISTWVSGADADAGLLAPATGAVQNPRNLVFQASASNVVPMTDWRRTSEQVQGGLVCRSGVTSGWHCGTIELTNRTKDVDGRAIDHQWVVDFDACPGDSGGPYVLDDIAYGIHTDSSFGCEPSKNQAWYSPIGWVQEVLAAKGHPIVFCTTTTCGAEINRSTTRGSLDEAGWDQGLITLENGRILKAGGASRAILPTMTSAAPPEPERYNPATGTWSDTAAPPWAPADCDGQYAVRLQDGRVLVGGGRKVGDSGPADACDGAHLFDPDDGPAGTWTTVAPPPAVLAEAGATLLEDGRAFVTGGSGEDGSTSIAMAYDPDLDAWEPLAAAPAGALDPLVLDLPDGRVLVSGGYVVADPEGPGYEHVSATHLYDPETDSWAPTTAVGARGVRGVVLRSGKVVLAGGQNLSWDGAQGSSFVSTVRRFDPATDQWTELAPLRTARAGFAFAEVNDGWLVALGGRISGGTLGSATRTGEAWNPATGTWYTAPSLNTAHDRAGSVVLEDGSLLVAGGGTSATETYILGDVQPPTVSAPSIVLRSSVTMSTPSVPIRLSWSATDAGVSGVGTYDIGRSTDGGAFTTIATSVTGTTYDTVVTGNHTYRFQVKPRDWAGNPGAWKASGRVRIGVTQQTSASISWTTGWTTASNSSYTGGSLKYSKTAGKSATYTFTGKGIAWVSTRGPARGSAKVYIDGALAATVSLYRSSVQYRYVAFQKSWSSEGRHTIKIVVVGTSGHPRVDIDAFEVLSIP